ncbi:pyroglutamyl-peptidase I [Rubrivivax gelatinosus]|uniref:Pyrrolidone-carboxylate peptidase n=1 Tax=Rubrivivax gelatinosus TaxID=28068 RepID=A0ABS1DUL2_RUBGE|nr:pyroglutamyl-peptidase I [Rubrivivax gelatinosus]MBK1713724.1 pyroglutamyl-peptidase I [Rubrivivax gelatinosus]
MKQPVLLLTGFEPFGGESINPSWEVCAALQGEPLDGLRIEALRLPCVFGAALELLDAGLARHAPALVLQLGQAGGRPDFTLERVAINVDDARIADNAGACPVDQPVVAGGPAAYFSTLPIKAMVAALQDAGLPASVSQSAGTFVCNHVFYGLMHRLATRPGVRGGFMHLPLLPEQAARQRGAPSLPLATQVEAVRLALRTAWRTREDLRVGGGAES